MMSRYTLRLILEYDHDPNNVCCHLFVSLKQILMISLKSLVVLYLVMHIHASLMRIKNHLNKTISIIYYLWITKRSTIKI